MPAKLPVYELVRLAMVYAEQDRRSFAEANRNNEIGAESDALADAFRAYRMKRWGKTTHEANMERATLVSVTELRRVSDETSTSRCRHCEHAVVIGGCGWPSCPHKNITAPSESGSNQ